MLKVAVQPDRLTADHDPAMENAQGTNPGRSFSERWLQRLSELGHEGISVDAFAPDFFDQIAGCDGFMWWFPPTLYPRELGRRIMLALSQASNVLPFPDWKECWHFDDKIAQSYLLEAAGIRIPKTWVFWAADPAEAFCRTAPYPLVIKLSAGVYSNNVALVRNEAEARFHIGRLFHPDGVQKLAKPPASLREAVRLRLRDGLRGLKRLRRSRSNGMDVHRDQLLVQEFLPGNAYDTRVTIIGKRAFGVRRFNRPNDFRASGSHHIDRDPALVAEDALRLAFRAARRLDVHSLAVDVLRRDGKPVLNEVSYFFPGYSVNLNSGRWELDGEPEDGHLRWVDGPISAEDATLDDFLERLQQRRRAPRQPAPF